MTFNEWFSSQAAYADSRGGATISLRDVWEAATKAEREELAALGSKMAGQRSCLYECPNTYAAAIHEYCEEILKRK